MTDIDAAIAQLNSSDRVLCHEAVEMLRESREGRAIVPLVNILRGKDAGLRDAAVNALIGIGGGDAARAVIPLLYEAEDASLRNMAVEVLGRLGDGAREVVEGLLNEKDEDILKFAIDILSVNGNAETIPVLIPFLNHQNPNIRAAAAVALGKLKAFHAAHNLIDMLSDGDEWVRFSVLEALGSLGSPDIVDRLLEAVRQDDVSRMAAIDAISNIALLEDCSKVLSVIAHPDIGRTLSADVLRRFIERFDGFIDEAHKEKLLNLLSTLLKGGDIAEQREALKGMTLLKGKRAIAVLLQHAKQVRDDDEETRGILKDALINIGDSGALIETLKNETKNIAIFVDVLGEIKDPTAVQELQGLIDNVDREVRRALIQSLEKIGAETSFDSLVKALHDKDGHVRRLAAKALGSAKDGRVVPILLDTLLKEPYRDVQDAIAEALFRYDGSKLEDAFVGLLFHQNPALRVIGVRGLGRTASDTAMPFLIKAVADAEPEVRKEAVKAVGCNAAGNIEETLTKLLFDESRDVRLTVLEAAAVREDGRGALLKAVENNDMWVRFKAINLIGEKRIAGAGDILMKLLRDDEIPVKVACAKAIGSLAVKESESLLKDFLNHNDAYLRDAAKDALAKING